MEFIDSHEQPKRANEEDLTLVRLVAEGLGISGYELEIRQSETGGKELVVIAEDLPRAS